MTFAEREKEMIGEAGRLGLTGLDESDFIGDAGIIQGVDLGAGRTGRTVRTCWTDRNGRKLCFEVRRRLSWWVWVGFVAVLGAICWGIRAAI